MQEFTRLSNGQFQCQFCRDFRTSKFSAWSIHKRREKHIQARSRYRRSLTSSCSQFIHNSSYSSAIEYNVSLATPNVEISQHGETVTDFFDNSGDWVMGEMDPALGVNFNEGLVEGLTHLHLQEQIANDEWERGCHIMEDSDREEAFDYQMDAFDNKSSDDELEDEMESVPLATPSLSDKGPPARPVIVESLEYFPYPSKQHAYSDILLNYLRNDVSEPLREVLWKMIPEMGMDNAPKAALPSKESMKIFAEKMKAMGVGAETKEYRGHRGNLVYVNDLPTMIAEAIANPLIRQHLTFLPESTPNQIQEIYQAEKWLEELSPRLLTPSVQYGSSLFFVDEVTELEDGRFFITSRWILQNGDIFGRGYQVNLHSNIQGLVVDCRSVLDIPLKSMVRNGLSTKEHIRGSYKIKGMITAADGFQHTEISVPISDLRTAHPGKRVVTVPVILYADDSSGNRSKKWNKHQSFYAVLAGLPNKLQQQEFFINFLGTSNVASALELLEGVATQILDAWRTPRSAWDAKLGEEVVYRPLVLLFEGDNPMQSEFCSIGGLASLKFCRTCHVGAETKAEEETEVNITKFMQCGQYRKPFQTYEILQAMLRTAADPSLPKSQISELQTSTGVKDTFTTFLIDQLFDIRKSFKGDNAQLQQELRRTYEEFHKNRFTHNPAFQLVGFDFNFHRDTPFEILHGILLGFVKYFWRDNIKRLSPDQKKLVAHRINALNTSGLEVSRINGETLVDYAHSLVGKDFRVIFQIATFALDLLIEQPYFQIWIALGRLGSIVWRPRVANKEMYLENLESAIKYFLDTTASLTTQWFNKRKFHLLVHLVDNVKRFGVPINYATEKFESYNGVMRLKSVHSNRHAPGKDIARSFSGFDRVRHIFSGGRWKDVATGEWVVASIKVRNILEDTTFRRLLGLTLDIPTLQRNSQNGSTTPGSWVLAPRRKREIPAKETILHRICPELPISSDGKNFNDFLHSRLRSFKTRSEEDATDQSFVLVNVTPADAYVFHIHELLLVESPSLDASVVKAFGRRLNFAGVHPSFSMPLLQPAREDTELSWKTDSAGIPHAIVNVQHACGLAGCTNDGTESVCQERQITSQTRKAISHRTANAQTHLYILNTHVTRNSSLLEPFIPVIPAHDRPTVIRLGTQRRRESKAVAARCKQQAALSINMLRQHPAFQPNFDVESLSDEQIRGYLQQLGQKVHPNIKLRRTLLTQLQRTIDTLRTDNQPSAAFEQRGTEREDNSNVTLIGDAEDTVG